MVPYDRDYRIRELNSREDVGAHCGVSFHLLEFRRSQFSWLIENVLRHRQLSHVMQKRCGLDCFDLVYVADADRFCKANGV